MNRRIAIVAAAAALSFAPAARAETASPKVGIGVGVEPLNLASAFAQTNFANLVTNQPPVSFFVPINIVPQFRIEPSFGYWAASADKNRLPNGATYRFSATSLGIGGFFVFAPPAPVGFYVGARLTLLWNSSSDVDQGPPQTTTDTKETDFFFAPSLGAEYAFSPHFTVGAEVQLPIAFYGNPTVAGRTVILDRTGVSTNTVIFLRYFF
jgi:hypothetical protein